MSPIYVPGNLIFAKEHFSAIVATGGTSIYDITIDNIRYRVHEFKTTGTSTFTISAPGTGLHPKLIGNTANTLEYLVIAGGGSGGVAEEEWGGDAGGGGGAGGVIYGTSVFGLGTYSVMVGAGGVNSNGGNSQLGQLTAIGGGKGANDGQNGNPGGSGGGASSQGPPAALSGGLGVVGQGNNGGSRAISPFLRGGSGGGGVSAPGQNSWARA